MMTKNLALNREEAEILDLAMQHYLRVVATEMAVGTGREVKERLGRTMALDRRVDDLLREEW